MRAILILNLGSSRGYDAGYNNSVGFKDAYEVFDLYLGAYPLWRRYQIRGFVRGFEMGSLDKAKDLAYERRKIVIDDWGFEFDEDV